ncbi:hypothetical protein ACFFMR_31070, partial [Micromonospora andamanensis]
CYPGVPVCPDLGRLLPVALKPEDLASPDWLGTSAAKGRLADNLVSAAQFLKDQQKIDAVPDLATVQAAIYTEGLPDALG